MNIKNILNNYKFKFSPIMKHNDIKIKSKSHIKLLSYCNEVTKIALLSPNIKKNKKETIFHFKI
jgi:hypothetical protein